MNRGCSSVTIRGVLAILAAAVLLYAQGGMGVFPPGSGGGGGGGTTSITRTAVSFSATPTFARSSAIQQFTITLTGNITSSTLSGASAGDKLSFEFAQDGTGSRTVAMPTGFPSIWICPTASSVTVYEFVWTGSAAVRQGQPATSGCAVTAIGWDSGNVSTFVDANDTVAMLGQTQTFTGNKIFTGILRVPNSTTLPATCAPGDSYMDSDATSGARWYLCESTNTWVPQGGSGTSYNIEGCYLTSMCAPPVTGTRQTMPSTGVKGVRITIPAGGSLTVSRLVYMDVGAAGDFVSGFWNDSSGGPTGTMITNSGCSKTDTNDGTGFKTITCGGATLTSGTYHWLFDYNSASGQILMVTGVSVAWASELSDQLSSRWAYKCSNTSSGSAGTRALPSSCGTQSAYTSAAMPVFYLSSRP